MKKKYKSWHSGDTADAEIERLNARIAELESEHDSETRWAKHYSDQVTALENELATSWRKLSVSQDHERRLKALVMEAVGEFNALGMQTTTGYFLDKLNVITGESHETA